VLIFFLKSVVGSSLKRAELLDFSAKRRNSDEKEQSRNVDILLKEQSSLERSLRSTDAVLGQAFATHDDLRRQSGILAGARNKALQMLSTSPMINNLIVKIRRAKQKDMIVLAITIAICLTFTVIYWWNK
jgi:Golgi SNAP receptor complex protein 1